MKATGFMKVQHCNHSLTVGDQKLNPKSLFFNLLPFEEAQNIS
jgi:hypothetical protein